MHSQTEQKKGIISQEISKSLNKIPQTCGNQKMIMSFEQFCSGQTSVSCFSEQFSRSNSQQDYDQSSSFSSSLPEKKKSKKKSKSGSGTSLGKRKRQQNRIRKSENQIQELIIEFRINQEWTKEKVAQLSEYTGLSESQVYKWNWDQRKKFNLDLENMEAEVSRDEFGGYCCKKWGKLDDFENDDNICKQLGLDVERLALEIVKADLEKRQKTKANQTSQVDKTSPLIIKKKEGSMKELAVQEVPLAIQTPKST